MTYETKFAPGDTAYTCSISWSNELCVDAYIVLEININERGVWYKCCPEEQIDRMRKWQSWTEKNFDEKELLTIEETKAYQSKALFKLIAEKETELAKLKKREEELLNGE